MSYTPIKQQPHSDLDEIGIRLGLHRLSNESIENYRDRLVLETHRRSGPSEQEVITSLSRRVGLFDLDVFEIDLVLDGDGIPLATNPKIEITSSRLLAYHDIELDPELEINFYTDLDTKFLSGIQDAFALSTYFTFNIRPDYSDLLPSKNLKYSNSIAYIDREILLNSTENKLANSRIKQIIPSNPFVFREEVFLLTDVDSPGKFYINYNSGVVYTYDSMGGLISYLYNQFPFRVFWQPMKVYPYKDPDKKYFHRNSVIDDLTGLPSYEVLNEKGASIANKIYSVHPLTWGK